MELKFQDLQALNICKTPELRDVESCDVAIVGVPFDAGQVTDLVQDLDHKVFDKLQDTLRTNYHPSYDVNLLKFSK